VAITDAQKAALDRGRATRAENIERRKRGETPPPRAKDTPVSDPEFVDALPPDDKAPKHRASANDGPTANTGRGKPGRPPGYSPKGAQLTKIRTGLVMLFTAAGMGVSMVDTYDGTVIATNAERLADAWTQVAEQNARVRKVLEAMLEGSAIGNAVMVSAMVFVPIAVHHGAAGPSLLDMAKTMGVDIPPDDASGTRSRPLASVPTPAADRPPAAAGVNTSRYAPQPDVPDVSYEDITLPGYSGPPDRAA
jgi:hypothetical protein